jgi:hypothetical protein
MKKLYTLIAAVAVVLSANAQNKAFSGQNSGHPYNAAIKVHALPANGDRAIGDTLMWFPSPGVYLVNTTDQANFAIGNEDNDPGTPNNAGTGEVDDWGLYFSTNNDMTGTDPTNDNFYHPWENPLLAGGTDSTFFWHATSWFNPAGQADNWLSFGPITLPAGATLSWTDRTNPAYRDGYKVFVTTTIGSTTPSLVDFVDPAIYTKLDSGTPTTPSATYATDTTWVVRSVGIPAAYSGQPIYVAFEHNANDEDVLYLDEFLLVESTAGVEEFTNGAHLFQNMPNPAADFTSIQYKLEHNAAVVMNVYDVTGKLISSRDMGDQAAGTYAVNYSTENLAAGVYYYSLSVDKNTTAAMKMVVMK